MNVFQYPDSINASAVQIWDSAAFDNEDSEGISVTMKNSWSNLQTELESQFDSVFESTCSKENLNPLMVNSLVSVESSIPSKRSHTNGLVENSQGKPLKLFFKDVPVVEPTSVVSKKCRDHNDEKILNEKKIDAEIEEIEKEIKKLSSRLEALRLAKAETNLRITEKSGRIVRTKFLETKESDNTSELEKKSTEEPLSASVKEKVNNTRGLSSGPAEIVPGVWPRLPSKLEITPIQPIHNRRKSCFWKRQDINEVKAVNERRKTLSLSPKSRKTTGKVQVQKQAAKTVGSKRPVKKDDGVFSFIEPKKLFKDGEKTVPTVKKPLRTGRIVASRYNQISSQPNRKSASTDVRKRSLQENDKDEGKRCGKTRASSVGKSRGNQGTEGVVKKKWEIPSEVVVYKGDEEKTTVSPVAQMADGLPKIKAIRCVNESPRDSGPAKRVAEQIGKRDYFCDDEDGETLVCQSLSFVSEDDEE